MTKHIIYAIASRLLQFALIEYWQLARLKTKEVKN